MTKSNASESTIRPCIFVKLTVSSKPNIQMSPLVTQHFARRKHRMSFFSKEGHSVTPLDQSRCEKHENFFSSSLHSRLSQQFLGTLFMPREFRRSCVFLLDRYIICNAPKGKRFYLTALIYLKP